MPTTLNNLIDRLTQDTMAVLYHPDLPWQSWVVLGYLLTMHVLLVRGALRLFGKAAYPAGDDRVHVSATAGLFIVVLHALEAVLIYDLLSHH